MRTEKLRINELSDDAYSWYSKLDGEPVTLRAVAFTDRNDQGLASSVRFFTDTAQLFG
jgi:hypothetical protein